MSKARNVSQPVLSAIKKIIPFVFGIAALVLIIAWLSGSFQTKIQPHRQTRPVRTVAGQATDEVHEITKSYIEEAVGTLRAASRTVISARVLATITEISVNAGEEVQAGDVLIRMGGEELDAKLRQAEQSRQAADATQMEAKTSYERIQQLFQQNAASQANLEEAARRLEVARTEVIRTEQAVNEAAVLLSYTTIRAPKAGRIVDRLAEPGDTARPGEPILVLYDASSMRLEAPVLEHLAVNLQVGQRLTVYVDALQREIQATVDEIVPQADTPSRSFLVKTSLPPASDLYEGMFGRLRVPAGERRHLCLNTLAIQKIGQLEFVDVVKPDKTLDKRFIKIGRLGMPGRVEVLSGLKAGEQVVLQGILEAEGTATDGDDNNESLN